MPVLRCDFIAGDSVIIDAAPHKPCVHIGVQTAVNCVSASLGKALQTSVCTCSAVKGDCAALTAERIALRCGVCRCILPPPFMLFLLPASLAHINPAFAGGKCGQLITRELNCAVGAARRGKYGVEPLKGDIHIDLSRPFRQGKGHTPPTACPVRRSTSSGASIVAFLPKKSLNFRLSILASPAATIKIQVSPLTKERVFAIRAGSVPSASAASATVALEESNSWMRPSRPCSFKNALTVSIAIVMQSEYAPLAFLSILYFMLQVPQPAATHPPSAQLPAFCHHGFHSPAPCAPLLPTGCAARLKIRPHRGPARQM